MNRFYHYPYPRWEYKDTKCLVTDPIHHGVNECTKACDSRGHTLNFDTVASPYMSMLKEHLAKCLRHRQNQIIAEWLEQSIKLRVCGLRKHLVHMFKQ